MTKVIRGIILSILTVMTPLASFAKGNVIQRAHQPIRNEYIVILNEDVAEPLDQIARQLTAVSGGRIRMTFSNVLRGFLVEMTPAQAEAFNSDVRVKSIEENGIVTISSTQSIPSGTIAQEPKFPATLWGLDRIDQAAPSNGRTDGSYSYCTNGANVRIYIVDTGVAQNHPEFGGRVDTAPDLERYLANPPPGQQPIYRGAQCWENFIHTSGAMHGTAVASLAAGATFGSAKGATIVDVRVFDCSAQASTAQIIKELDWIPTDPNRGTAPRVVNCSFSVYWAPSITAAVDRLVDDGITVVVAAGNNNDNTLWYSPSASAKAIKMGGLDKASDARWYLSNYRVDFYAPAQHIEAASTKVIAVNPFLTRDYLRSEADDCVSAYPYTVDGCTSGTSFAAPLASGLVARYLQTNPSASPSQVRAFLVNQSSSHVNVTISDPAGGAPVLNMFDCP